LKASFREVFQPLRDPDRDWVGEIAPDFYKSGESDEGKKAFLERREPDFTRFPR
jgi:1,4-dihydroxy-2-naphthoyl-CoA synthase